MVGAVRERSIGVQGEQGLLVFSWVVMEHGSEGSLGAVHVVKTPHLSRPPPLGVN